MVVSAGWAMTGSRRIRTVICDELSATDNLMFFVEQVDELILAFRESSVKGFNLTVEQIVEELLPPEDCDLKTAMDHGHALAVSLAIMLQRAVTG
jgi:hypothetical protein